MRLGRPVEGLYVYEYSFEHGSGHQREFALYARSNTEFEEEMLLRERPISYSRYLEFTDQGLFEVGSAVGSAHGYEERRVPPQLLLPSSLIVGEAWEPVSHVPGFGWDATRFERSMVVTDVEPTTWRGELDVLVTVREVMTESGKSPPPPTAGVDHVSFTVTSRPRPPTESIRIYLASRCMLMSETIVFANRTVSRREIASFPSN